MTNATECLKFWFHGMSIVSSGGDMPFLSSGSASPTSLSAVTLIIGELPQIANDTEGRFVSETDTHGATTLRQYSVDDRTNTVIHADGGTVVTVLNPDGSVSSITGTATLPEFCTYSVSNGLTATEVRYGRADSPRYKTTCRNGFGETVLVERSGFGGATLVTENEYDAQGRLVSTAQTGKPTVNYAYDDWGERTSTVQSADGVVRTVEQPQAYALIDREVWFGGYQRRFYCPDLGRWLNRDPIEEEGGGNLYCFLSNNPICCFDSLGYRTYKMGWHGEPHINFDNDFPYDPTAKASLGDYWNWTKWKSEVWV